MNYFPANFICVKRKFLNLKFQTKSITMKIIIAALAAMLLFIACSDKEKVMEMKLEEADIPAASADQKYELEEFIADTIGYKSDEPAEDKKKQQQSQPTQKPDWDKKIIKTATLNFEVKDYTFYYSDFREKVKGLGGYVAQEEQTESDYKIENTITIKVPVNQFDNAITLLTTGVEKINERKVSSQDVTTEIIDTKSRIEAKKRIRQRYMDLLGQAKNMEEVLNVQSEINGIQEQIESAATRTEYLGHSSSFSTINLTYYQVLNSSAKDDSSPSFGVKISQSFKNGWSWICDLFVGLVSVWPLYLLGFCLFLVYKKFKLAKPKQAG